MADSLGRLRMVRALMNFDALEFIHQLLNSLAPMMARQALFAFLPLYVFLKFLHYLWRSIFAEDIAGKVVLIAGASSGIGEHLAYEYASRGAYLVLAARRERSLQEVADIAYQLGSPNAIAIHADVSSVDDCKRLINEAISHFGRLDHLVITAGVTPLDMFEDLDDPTVFAPAMDINFWGSVYTTYFAIPHLKRSSGKIIAITSSASWLNAPRMSFYNASKAAAVIFYETLRVEVGSEIGITIVTPGLIESEMTKGKFLTKKGKMEVDQDMRDVELSIAPIESTYKFAKATVDAACRGDYYLTEPFWYRTTFFYRVFCPEIMDWLLRWFLIPGPGMPETEALSKKILDMSGLKPYLYPPSLLSPEIKTD